MPADSQPHAVWTVGIDVPRGPVDDAVFERILRKLGKRPVAWVIPASEGLKSSALLGWIAQRRDHLGDIVFPKGYAGSLHPLLTHDELEKELEWGLHNPWSTGMADLFGSAPDLLMPRLPDLARESARALYRQMGFHSIGVPVGVMPAPDGTGLKTVPYLRIPDGAGSPGIGAAGRSALSRHDRPLLLIDIARILRAGASAQDAPSLSILDAALDAALRIAVAAGPLGPLFRLLPVSGNQADCSEWDGIRPHELRRAMISVGELRRKKRRKNEEYQKILSLLAGTDKETQEEVPAAGEADPVPRNRTPIAHMQGEVLLAGSDFDVILEGGRFCGIASKGRMVVPRIPAESSLTLHGTRLAFRTVSATSFEGDGCTGLREELRLERLGGSTMAVDYFFLDGFPHLLIHVEVIWPELGRDAPVDACVPFGMRLFPLESQEEVLIHSCGSDGDVMRLTRDMRGCTGICACGSFLHIAKGNDGVTLSFPTSAGATQGMVPFRIVEDGKGAWLEANPFGNWSRFLSDWTAGRTECFTFAIGIGGATPPRKPPALPRVVKEETAS